MTIISVCAKGTTGLATRDPIDAIPSEKVMIPAPIKPEISVEDLEKVDIRVGTILAVEDVPRSQRLVKMTVDLGDHRRTILVGMKTERSDPVGDLVGRQTLFVVNLAPRKMAGELSQGMLFDIGSADGILPVAAFLERPVPNGTRAA
jgi:tRNA-binding protein